MLSKKQIFGSLIGLGFWLGISSSVVIAQMPHEMSPHSATESTTQFRQIDQPLGLKVGVTIGGIALIGLELWWFLFSKNQARQAESNQGV